MSSLSLTNSTAFSIKNFFQFLDLYLSRHHHRLTIVEPFKSTTVYHHHEEEKQQRPPPPPILTPSPPQFHGTDSSYIEDFYPRHRHHTKHFPFDKNNNNSKYDAKNGRQYSADYDSNASSTMDRFEKIDGATMRYLRQKHFQFGNNDEEILSTTAAKTTADKMAEPIRRYSPPVSSNHYHHQHHLLDINGNDVTRTSLLIKEPVSSTNCNHNYHSYPNHNKTTLSKDPEISSFTSYSKTSKILQKENEDLALPTTTTSSASGFKHITNSNDKNNNNDILVVRPSSDRSFFVPTSMPTLSNESRKPSEDDAGQIKAVAPLAEDKQRARPKQPKPAVVNGEKPKARNGSNTTTTASKSTRQFSCKYCDKDYMSLGALKMHIRTHTLPCKCTICGKAFSRPWLLQGHIRTHTGERPFGCSYCGRAFADRSNLRAHIQTHTHAKKHECSYCSKTFSRASLLKKHEASDCLANITRRET